MPVQDTSAQGLRFIRCIVGRDAYCLQMKWLRGIRRIEELDDRESVPNSVGTVMHGGDPVPIFPLECSAQSLHDMDRQAGKILLLNTDSSLWGLLVDRVESEFEATFDDYVPLPALVGGIALKWFEGIVQSQNQMTLVLSPDGLCPQRSDRSLHSNSLESTAYRTAHFNVNISHSELSPKVILFSANLDLDFRFGLSLMQVPQIVHNVPILHVPGADRHVLGLMEWRGTPLVVMDLLNGMSGGTLTSQADERMLIARVPSQSDCVGFPINSQVHIRSLPIAHEMSTCEVPLDDVYIKGKFMLDEILTIIPDIDTMIDTN